MNDAKFDPEIRNVLDRMFAVIPGINSGKMFGYPAYYIKGHMFACIYEKGVGIKVPPKKAEDLARTKGVTFFQPLGRTRMKSWIFIERNNPEDYRQDLSLFLVSIEYVSSAGNKI